MSYLSGRKRLVAACACLGACVLAAALAYSQDAVGDLARKLDELTAQLRRQREEHNRDRQLAENEKALLLEEIDSLKTREEELKGRRDALEAVSAQLGSELEKLTEQADGLEDEKAGIEEITGGKTQELLGHIGAGLPLESRERAEAASALLAGCETPGECCKLLWQLWVQEFRRAGEIEITSPVIEEPSGPRPEGAPEPPPSVSYTVKLEGGARLLGRVLRVGSVGAVFLSDDGKTAAILLKTAGGYVWREVASREELAGIRHVFEIAEGRRAPQIVRVPLQLALSPVPAPKPAGEKKPEKPEGGAKDSREGGE
jgi:hypothetical protein